MALCGGAFRVKETEVGAFTWRDALRGKRSLARTAEFKGRPERVGSLQELGSYCPVPGEFSTGGSIPLRGP